MSDKKRKLLLINPLSTKRIGLINDHNSIYPPMSLAIIAALTPDNWEIELVDENFERFTYRDADLVGITALTSQVTRAYEIAEIYRKANITTVMGGIHISMMPDEAKHFADTLVIGEAESVWKNLITDFENGELKEIYKGKLESLLNSPPPRIDLYNKGYEFGSVQTTRGCPMSCDFCSVHRFNGKKYRPRPVKDVIDDFERTPQNRIYVVDDNFIGYSKKSAQRVIDICKGIIERNIKKDWLCSASMNIADNDEVLEYMTKAGCRMIFLGIESELIDQLKDANKYLNAKIGVNNFQKVYDKIHSHGIAVLGAFIFGLDTDTAETIQHRVDYMLNADIDAMQATVLTPLPGTPLFDRMQEENRLIYNNYPEDWSRYDFVELLFKHNKMSNKELNSEIKLAWEKLYDPKRLKRKFISALKATKNPISATWSYNSNLHYHNLVFENTHKKIELKNKPF